MRRALSVCYAALSAVVCAATAFAGDESAKPSDCAMMRTIDRWSVIDDRTVIIETPAGRQYKVTFTGTCPDLKRAVVIHVKTRASSGVCVAPGDSFVFSHTVFPSRVPGNEDSCMIKSVEGVARAEPAKDATKPN